MNYATFLGHIATLHGLTTGEYCRRQSGHARSKLLVAAGFACGCNVFDDFRDSVAEIAALARGG